MQKTITRLATVLRLVSPPPPRKRTHVAEEAAVATDDDDNAGGSTSLTLPSTTPRTLLCATTLVKCVKKRGGDDVNSADLSSTTTTLCVAQAARIDRKKLTQIDQSKRRRDIGKAVLGTFVTPETAVMGLFVARKEFWSWVRTQYSLDEDRKL